MSDCEYQLLIHTRKVSGKNVYHSGFSLVKIDSNNKKTIQMIEVYSENGKLCFSGMGDILDAREYTVNENNIIWGEFFFIGGTLQETTQSILNELSLNTYEVATGEQAKKIFNKIKFDAELREKLSFIPDGRQDYDLTLRNCNGWTKYLADKYNLQAGGLSFLNLGLFWEEIPSFLAGEISTLSEENHKSNIIKKAYDFLDQNYPDIDYGTIEIRWIQNPLQVGVKPYLSLTIADSIYFIDSNQSNGILNGQSGTADNNLTILTGGGGDTVNNSGSHVTIDTGSGEYTDSIVSSGSDVEINTGAGRDYINNSGDNTTINAGAGSDTIINTGDNAVIHAGEGADLIQDFGGGNTTIDLGNDNVTDRVVLRKEDGSSTQIINAGASDQLVIKERELIGVDRLGEDLRLILSGMEVIMKNGANAGPDYIWIKDDRYRRENGTYVLDKQEDGLVAEIVNIGIDMESGSVFGNEMCFKAA